MNPALRIAPNLTVARLRSRAGDAWLDVLAVLSFAVSALMALTVAGGIWMFKEWKENPAPEMLAAMDGDESRFTFYLVLAIFAGVLLVMPIFSLGASATRLGAQGRARRLASLRLVGVTPGQTVAITMVETFVQWTIGTGLGTLLYYVTLPLWSGVTFLENQAEPSKMLLPIGLLLAILLALFVIAMVATVAGLQRVRISPLGVARHETNPALKYWRPIAFLVAVGVFWGWTITEPNVSETASIAAMAFFLGLVIAGLSLIGPWVFQMLARPATKTRSVPRLLAMRRIIDDPKASWRQVSALALLCFIAGFVSSVPATADTGSGKFDITIRDINTGTYITIAFGFVVAALSTLMNQASNVFDRAQQTRALTQVGLPRRIFALTRIHQVLGPLAGTTVVCVLLGRGLAYITSTYAQDVSDDGLLRLALALAAGIGLSAFALLTCQSLESHVLSNQRRRND